jgi:hypothetical protein
MYEPESILKRRDPVAEDDAAAPYNRVRVIGQSPVVHPVTTGWAGVQSTGVILEPMAGFAAHLDEPLGKVQELYELESAPERQAFVNNPVKVVTPGTAGPSPEEVFEEARRKASRGRRNSNS